MTFTMPSDSVGTAEDRRRLHRKLWIRIAILAVILGAASLLVWRLGYFQLLANGGLRRLMDRLHRVPRIRLVLGTSDAYWIARLVGGKSAASR
jgi:hypothetical protein